MIGFRGASRYYNPRYQAGFMLECLAMKKVRDEMGLKNLKLMIPFCRTVEEGRRVQAEMEKHGLKRGEDGLEIYVMCEIPSNVILASEFAEIFDGFSIGSNDLTQLILGVDRDSEIVAHIFDERNPAVKDHDRAGHRGMPRKWTKNRDLRPGAQRLSRVCPVPRRAGHRQHFTQSRYGPQDHARNPAEGGLTRMKIIVGTDFSKNARAAGTAAAALVRRWNETLLVAHVFDDSVSGRLPSDIRETLAASTNDRLHDEAVHLGSEGLKVEEHMLSGAPEKELADLAVRSEARLVVVSSVGRSPR